MTGYTNLRYSYSLVFDPEKDSKKGRCSCEHLSIILNAVQAMPEGGRLTIKTAKHGDSVKITFKDSGVGIPEETLPKLFTPLFSTKTKGVDLGLVICKQIVEGHAGNITVKSKEGKGSTFTIKLPIHINEEVGEAATINV